MGHSSETPRREIGKGILYCTFGTFIAIAEIYLYALYLREGSNGPVNEPLSNVIDTESSIDTLLSILEVSALSVFVLLPVLLILTGAGKVRGS